jgi:hypothetical protein
VPTRDEQKEILRRIAERGLRLAQTAHPDLSRPSAARAAHEAHLDLWQHMLDEIERLDDMNAPWQTILDNDPLLNYQEDLSEL